MHVLITDEAADGQQVREAVFQQEQGIARDLDFDGEDDNALHVVAYNDDEEPIGTARMRFFDQGKTAKIERMAVIMAERKTGVGRAMVETIDEYLRNRNVEKAYMNSRQDAQGFYERCGYVVEGELFNEVGIPHVQMVKRYNL